ncbi:MAG: NAD(P)/FAD-dependent oxidoreductase [Spirochaetales bacterium]|nr:NAD(P)/FAD-dependent oxidoreductase [Spirochaetales bacterium]
MDKIHDVIVIGAGAVGCAIARELSRYRLSVLVLEKECDVAFGTSGRMSGVVHAGFNNKVGSLMARLCVEGNRLFEGVCRELDIPYRKTGKVLVAFNEDDMKALEGVIAQGKANGCDGLKLIGQDEIRAIAPGIGGIGGMISPNTAIFDPFEFCIAHAENAMDNGVDFSFESEVTSISRKADAFEVTTPKGVFRSRFIVNSAGLYCDKVSAMLGVDDYKIYPCRGQYYILDKIASELLSVPAYPVPRPGIGGLGIHLTPTIDGNIIIGPSAEYQDDADDYATTAKVLDQLFTEAKALLPAIERRHIIGSYCGIRPKQAPPGEGGFRDFVIKEEPSCPGLINLIGIESPGFTAAVPISFMVRDILAQHIDLVEKSDFKAERKAHIRFRDLPREEQEKLIASDPEYGEIICRCQNVTKREIRDAIENRFGARSISSIKYRAWATTGRCNGGYCLAKIVDMLIHDYHMKPEEISYRGSGSEMFSGEVK